MLDSDWLTKFQGFWCSILIGLRVCEVLFSQNLSEFIANIATENVSQAPTKPRLFNCRLNLNFLPSSRHFNCNTVFVVIVTLLNEIVHGFNNISNGRVETGFQMVKFQRLRKFLIKKHEFSICNILIQWWVKLPKLQPPIDLSDSVAPMKKL